MNPRDAHLQARREADDWNLRADLYHDLRSESIARGEAGFSVDGPVLVVHLIPEVAFEDDFREVGSLDRVDPESLPIIAQVRSHGTPSYAIDGVLSRITDADGETLAAASLAHTGIVEAVTTTLFLEQDGELRLPSPAFEAAVVGAIGRYLDLLADHGITENVRVSLTLGNVADVRFAYLPDRGRTETEPFQGDRVTPFGVTLETVRLRNRREALAPLIDAVWRSAGFEGSRHYDATTNEWSVADRASRYA